jgi:hypothetical protein
MKVWTKQEIRTMLETNDVWVIRGMLAIFEYQTADEQAHGRTEYDNGVGFNGVDAEILTSFVEQYKARNFLSPKQIAIARKKMLKYAGQLVKIAKIKADSNKVD